jgi:hypothetical protein
MTARYNFMGIFFVVLQREHRTRDKDRDKTL